MKSAIKRCFTMPPQVTCASALPDKTGNTKIALFTHCVSAVPEFNQSLLYFFSLFDSRLILTLLYDSLNLVINAFSLGLLGGHGSRERKSESCSSWTVLHTQSTSALSSGLLLLQGNAEALNGWDGKTFLLFQQHFCQKLSQSDWVCQDYSKWKGDVFWDTVYIKLL